MAGRRVTHRIHGRGTVTGERYLGNELLVEFLDGVSRWVPARELIVSEADIIKSAIHAFNRTHRIADAAGPKKPYVKPEDPAPIFPDARPVSEDLLEDIAPEVPQGKPEPVVIPEISVDNVHVEPEPVTVPTEPDPTIPKEDADDFNPDREIQGLLQKVHELEQLPADGPPAESDISHTTEKKPAPVFRMPGIQIIEEALPTPAPGGKRKTEHQEVPEEKSDGPVIIHTRSERKILIRPNEECKPPTVEMTTETTHTAPVPEHGLIPDISIKAVPDKETVEIPVIPEDSEPVDTDSVRPEQKIKPFSPERQAARCIIEALRVGIVPHHRTDDFSCGREKESEIFETWLQKRANACMFLNGDYGSGKSHMLEIIAAKALKKKWAVAVVEIDPDELPFYLPKRIYQQIVHSLRYYNKNQELGFRDLITAVMETKKSGKADILKNHPLVGNLYSAWHDSSNAVSEFCIYDKCDLLDWIEGERPRLHGFPELKDQQTAANVYCNLLSVIGWCARNILNLQGLLVLFDEGEGIDRSLYTAAHFKKSENFLKGLLLMAYSDPVLLNEYEFMVTEAIPRGNRFGEETGLYYGGTKRNTSSFLWQDTSHVKLLFALTPGIVPVIRDQIIRDPALNVKITEIELEELREEHLKELFSRITAVYNTAYGSASSDSIYQYLVKTQTRLFVKSAVEALDVMRFNPSTYHEELQTAIAQKMNFS